MICKNLDYMAYFHWEEVCVKQSRQRQTHRKVGTPHCLLSHKNNEGGKWRKVYWQSYGSFVLRQDRQAAEGIR